MVFFTIAYSWGLRHIKDEDIAVVNVLLDAFPNETANRGSKARYTYLWNVLIVHSCGRLRLVVLRAHVALDSRGGGPAAMLSGATAEVTQFVPARILCYTPPGPPITDADVDRLHVTAPSLRHCIAE